PHSALIFPSSLFLLTTRPPPTSTLFPYTTLFRSIRDENAHNDKSVHGVLNPTYQAGLRRDAVQPDIEAERKKRDEIEAGKISQPDRKSGSAGMPRPISYAVFCLKKKKNAKQDIKK